MTSKLGPTGLLGFLLLFGIAQMAISKADREPYPALYQPSFANSAKPGNAVQIVVPTVDVTYTDGSTAEFNDAEIIGHIGVSSRAVFSKGFLSKEKASDPETIEWVEQRLIELSIDKTPVSATITWHRYDEAVTKPPGPALEIVDEVRLDLMTR